LDFFDALFIVIVIFIVFIVVFALFLLNRGLMGLSPPEKRVILDWPKEEIIEHHKRRRGYLMTHTIPFVDPIGPPLFKEDRRGGTAIYRNGIMAYCATVAVEDVTGWSSFIDGYRAVATLTHEFVPWSHVSGIYPLEIRDHGTSQDGNRTVFVLGFPIDITRHGRTPRVFIGLQVETVDHRTIILAVLEGDHGMFESLKKVLEPVWVTVYHPQERLLGYLWDEQHKRVDYINRDLDYFFEEYAKGDIYKVRDVREREVEDVVWF
jgi:hypothetical protein